MSEQHIPIKDFPLPPVIEEITDWPIYQLSEHKEGFLAEVIHQTVSKLGEHIKTREQLYEVLSRVLYHERIRIKQNPWAADPPDENEFWRKVKEELLEMQSALSDNGDEPIDLHQHELLNRILQRYANEIVGNFKPSTYRFAKKVIPRFISWLFNASPKNRRKARKKGRTIYDKARIYGDIEKIRKLSKEGTVIMLPTHFSNLDSPVVGWAIDAIGLPGFIYGAGLNLFGIKLLASYMNRLGAYKVDRRKKNLLYLELLKNYSSIAIQRGAHSLFFPGGTRSRSGHLEKQLKLGLLGTAVEAQRIIFTNEADKPRKIFILPLIINYHFVLEAPALISDHLKREGKSRYIADNDEFSTSFKMIQFLFKFIMKGSNMSLSFGPVMDVFGNKVDDEGRSINHLGQEVDIRKYFVLNGQMKEDQQREKEYTRMLEKAILEKYYTHNIVLSSQLLAFTAFEMIKNTHPELDIYSLIRLPEEDIELDKQTFYATVDKLRTIILGMEQRGEIIASAELSMELDELIKDGMKNAGLYHASAVLKENREGKIITEDLKVLFYYHNRLEGYGLEEHI